MRTRKEASVLPRLLVAGVAVVAGMLALGTGCDPRLTSALKRLQETQTTRPVAAREAGLPPAGPDLIRVATFNLQVFGTTKLSDPAARDLLATIISQFDVVAVQEIRSVDQTVLEQLVQRINTLQDRQGQPLQFDYFLGPRLGRTSNKEQYGFVFDTRRIDVDRRNVYTLVDGQDLLHREPFIARFAARSVSGVPPFTFTLVNVHVDPDMAMQEVDLLDDVLQVVRNDGSQEDDIILLGDLNAAPRQFNDLLSIPGLTWVVDTTPTNTRRTEVYDNILMLQAATVEFRRGGVFDFPQVYKLSEQEALDVSDHLPVWAEFVVREGETGGAWAMTSTPQEFR